LPGGKVIVSEKVLVDSVFIKNLKIKKLLLQIIALFRRVRAFVKDKVLDNLNLSGSFKDPGCITTSLRTGSL
jgi:hypothetical protein